MNVRRLARSALIAALYALLTTLLQAFSFGPIQLRVAEALTLLPILVTGAPTGLAIGCLIGNLLGGAVWYDVILGTMATFLAGRLTARFRDNLPLAAAMPVIVNALCMGPVVYLAYAKAPDAVINGTVLWSTIATIGAGEALSVYGLGIPLLSWLKKLPLSLFQDQA